MKKILITGGCGFVGRELVKLTSKNFEVHVADNLHCGKHRLNKMDLDSFNFHLVDLRDYKSVTKLVKKINPEIIYHLAAIHFIPQCEEDPNLALSTNLLSTINLLNNIDQTTKFVYISSAAVYAPSKLALFEDRSKINPVDVYGFTKLHGEDYTKLFMKRKNIEAVIVRLFNVIGPGETNPHILPEIMSQLKKGQKVLNLGNIQSKRDFIDVRDVANGLIKIGECKFDKLSNSTILNLGSGKTYSMKDLLNYVKEISKLDFSIKKDPKKLRAVDNPVLLASLEKIKSEIGWTPKYSIKETLIETWKDDIIIS